MEPDRPALPGNALGTNEIEVTPEMIGAGLVAYSRHDPNFETDEDAVLNIFLAMIRNSKTEARVSAESYLSSRSTEVQK